MSRKVVLAYSGGLDTSAIVPWLKENYDCEVVCFAANVGQVADELDGIAEKAIRSGACDCYVADLFLQSLCFLIDPVSSFSQHLSFLPF